MDCILLKASRTFEAGLPSVTEWIPNSAVLLLLLPRHLGPDSMDQNSNLGPDHEQQQRGASALPVCVRFAFIAH